VEADRSGNNKVNLKKKVKKCVIIDTNVLMYVYLARVDIFGELKARGYFKFLVPDCVVKELEVLRDKAGGKYSRAANFALHLIEKEKIEVIKSFGGKGTDEKLLELSKRNDCVLLTNDRELKKKARERGIRVGYVREMNRLFLED